ncbi:MAG: YdeI/OmpD-associated family protein [Labilithrix sp.]|nr:YdeI/OmpD-associated family protein [Labilithrix sp.]
MHELPAELRKALLANAPALAAWKDVTPLARNEFICWVEDAKKAKTRARRVRRTRRSSWRASAAPAAGRGAGTESATGADAHERHAAHVVPLARRAPSLPLRSSRPLARARATRCSTFVPAA